MPVYRIQREYTAWEEAEVEADTVEEALEKAEEDWQDLYPYTVDSYNYTGEMWSEEKE